MKLISHFNKKGLAEIALIYAAIVWGSTFFLVKDCLDSIDPITLVAYRFSLAAIILGGWLYCFKKPLFKQFKEGAWLGILVWIAIVTQTVGLKYTTATNSGFITALFVVFVPLLSFVLKKTTPTTPQMIAILLSIVGLWLLTGGVGALNQGDLLTLVCAFVCAIHILSADKLSKMCNPFTLCFQQFLVIAILSFLTIILLQLPLGITRNNTWWALVFLTLIPTLSAFLVQLLAQKTLGPFKVSLIFSLEPLFATFFACLLGGESLTLGKGLGGVFLFAAMLVAELPVKKPKDRILPGVLLKEDLM